MKRYELNRDLEDYGPYGPFYLCSDADARIAELEGLVAGLLDVTDPFIRVKAREALKKHRPPPNDAEYMRELRKWHGDVSSGD